MHVMVEVNIEPAVRRFIVKIWRRRMRVENEKILIVTKRESMVNNLTHN